MNTTLTPISLETLVKEARDKSAGEILINAYSRPALRINGRLVLLQKYEMITAQYISELVTATLPDGGARLEDGEVLETFCTVLGERMSVSVFPHEGVCPGGMVLKPVNPFRGAQRVFQYKDRILEMIQARGDPGNRRLILVASPPQNGKSTLARELVEQLGWDVTTVNTRERSTFASALTSQAVCIDEVDRPDWARLVGRSLGSGLSVIATVRGGDIASAIRNILFIASSDYREEFLDILAICLHLIVYQELVETHYLGEPSAIAAQEYAVISEDMKKQIAARDWISFMTSTAAETSCLCFDDSLVDCYRGGLATLEEILIHARNIRKIKMRLSGMEFIDSDSEIVHALARESEVEPNGALFDDSTLKIEDETEIS